MVNLSLLAAILRDLCLYRRDMTEQCEHAISRLHTHLETRGPSIFLVDFPEACKKLDASLSGRPLDYESLSSNLTRKDENGVFRPSFIPKLWDEVVEWWKYDGPNGLSHADPNLVFFLRQILLLYKKLRIDCPHENVHAEINEYIRIEEEMRKPSRNWDDDLLDIQDSFEDRRHLSLTDISDSGKQWMHSVVQSIADIIVSKYPVLDPMCIIPSHGPGAVADLKTGHDKYGFRYWPTKLSNVFDELTFARYSYSSEYAVSDLVNHEVPAKLIAVPKTFKAPRLIAAEPLAHQFLQQGLRSWLIDNTPYELSHSVHVHDQRKNQEAALAASSSGLFATVDLSSASDRLSCWLVERVFRQNVSLLRALHSVRSRWVSYPSGRGPERQYRRLRKYANQGSAVTFVLQSHIYAIICISAVVLSRGEKFSPSTLVKRIRDAATKVLVFGDDLVVPSTSVSTLVYLLKSYGLKVNESKTHSVGHFRESCGVDAYAGYDITPVYVKSTEQSTTSGVLSWIEQSNVAYLRGLWSLSDVMVNSIPSKFAHRLPVSSSPLGCLYLCTRQIGIRFSGKGRYNPKLQRPESRVFTLRTRKLRRDRVADQDLLHYFISSSNDREINLSKLGDPFAKALGHVGYLINPVQIRTGWVALMSM